MSSRRHPHVNHILACHLYQGSSQDSTRKDLYPNCEGANLCDLSGAGTDTPDHILSCHAFMNICIWHENQANGIRVRVRVDLWHVGSVACLCTIGRGMRAEPSEWMSDQVSVKLCYCLALMRFLNLRTRRWRQDCGRNVARLRYFGFRPVGR